MIASLTPPEPDSLWLEHKYFDEVSLQFRTVWDLYIKFYTVFLTVQIAGLGAIVQYVAQSNRILIVLAFILNNKGAYSLNLRDAGSG
jgi:hypothetical protein